MVSLLKQAIDDEDLEAVKKLMTADPELHQGPIGYNGNGPLTWVAECRGSTATPQRLAIAGWMIKSGSNVHQGGDGPLMRAALLLHMAIEYHELDIARWLIDQGADVDARASTDSDGFGGHTPLFHATVTLGTKSDTLARLLLDHAATPNARATFRKQLRMIGDAQFSCHAQHDLHCLSRWKPTKSPGGPSSVPLHCQLSSSQC